MFVDDDAIGALEAAGHCEFVGRDHSNANDDCIRLVLAAVVGEYGTYSSRTFVLGNGANPGVAYDPHPVAGVLVRIERGDLWAGHPVHHSVRHLEDGDVEPQFPGGRCHLKPNVATPDHDQASAGSQVGSEAIHILDRS